MIDFPLYNFSTPIACVFTEMLHKLLEIPNNSKIAPNWYFDVASEMLNSKNTYTKQSMESIFELPYFVTSFPESGSVNNCPSGIMSNIMPSSPSEMPKFCLMVGILLAQDAKMIPVLQK